MVSDEPMFSNSKVYAGMLFGARRGNQAAEIPIVSIC
jgi:hypothetical protein